MRVKLKIEYEGTQYAGWQVQQNALSVQEVLEHAVFQATGQRVRLTGAGRTDAGVHAYGQCAHMDIETSIPPEKLSYALNLVLPEDIRVRDSRRVPDDFHARKSAYAKQYRYCIYNAPHAAAIDRHTCAHVRQPLCEQSMRAAAAYLRGRHDFAAFQSAGSPIKDTVRKIYTLEVRRVDDFIYIDVVGNGFLYNMVRILAGTLIEVGKGLRTPASIAQVVQSRDRAQAGATAPAKGLALMEVFYEQHIQ